MPSSTVEDYLKRIWLEQERTRGEVVPPRAIARALGVSPGTVTSMMKTLTEAGLVTYEPYSGVLLTGKGRRLATHVLRRHRLLELFLVRILGMDWSDVHQEAEELEHAVSDRVLDRIDEMLDHPSFDPHGDPIPTASGTFPDREPVNLLDCAIDASLRIARVTDQRAEFLRLLERHRLIPGRRLSVSGRDELAETVTVCPAEGEPLQLGFRAAARVWVEENRSPE